MIDTKELRRIIAHVPLGTGTIQILSAAADELDRLYAMECDHTSIIVDSRCQHPRAYLRRYEL